MGRSELEPYPDAIEALHHEHDEYGWRPVEIESHLAALDEDGQPSAYLLRWRACGQRLAYSDFA